MMAGLLALLVTLTMFTPVMAGTWTSNNFLYKPAIGARGEAEKAKFDSGLNLVDSRLAKEIWLGDPGGTPGYDTLAHAITTIGSNSVILRVAPGIVSIATDTIIPANITLEPERGATFAVATGKTLTINGSLEAGLYQIFSCSGTGKAVFKGKKYPEWWGAKDDSGTTDNTAAIIAALANGGLTKFRAPNGGYYKCTTAIPIAVAGTRVFSDAKAEIRQATAATKLFSVSANNIKFRGVKLSGIDVATGGSFTAKAAIYSEGTKAVPLDRLEVMDCEISNYEAGVWAPWTNAKIADSYIHDIAHGVIGGTGAWVPEDQNFNGDIQYEIINNKIVCTFGDLVDSRPITLPLFTGGALITGNYLRGGGMSVENVLISATANANRVKVLGNDCDTAISASNGDVVGHNTVDLAQAPVGRGQQSNFFQGIETGYNSTVIGNIVRNHTNGVGHVMPNMRVIGNFFIDCGDQGGGAGVGMGGVVVTGTDLFAADTVMNALIANNTFKGTKGSVVDIYMNWNGAHALIGLTIIDNQSYNGNSRFFIGKYIQHSKISGNYVYNACTSITGVQAFGMWVDGASSSVEFMNNTFINTVAAPNGMYQGIAPQSSDIIGFNKFVGMRLPSTPFDTWNAPKVLCSQMNDGAFWSPKKDNFTMAAAASKTVTNKFVTATSQIRLEPTNAAAATLMGGAKSLYVSAKTSGTSFVVSTANAINATGTETFNYEIMD